MASFSIPSTANTPPVPWDRLPEIDLRQLLNMTDDTGMFQHAWHAMPDPNHGYCIDDNARALIAALYHAELRGYNERVVPLLRYLTFLRYAFNDKVGRFRNFMGYERNWLEEVGSTDSQGRTLWALGLCARLAPNDTIRDSAVDLFNRGLPALESFRFLRSLGFALIGLHEFLQVEPGHTQALAFREDFAERLARAFNDHADLTGEEPGNWPWWEDTVTYDNAKLCQAMLVSGSSMGRADMVEIGERALRWLLRIQTGDRGQLSIIGNNGWYPRGGKKAPFDQQPLEAHAMVEACLIAAELAGDDARRGWFESEAWRCFEWFTGRNDIDTSMINADTGACHDGLLPAGVNKNQGAESVLAYLLSVLELHRYRQRRRPDRVAAPGNGGGGRGDVDAVGLGIVGASGFAEFCLEQYRGLPGLEPVAVWNRTAAKAHDLAQRAGLRSYDRLPDMLADPRVRLVHIGTTPNIHAEQALVAIDAGKHVLCEKPIAAELADAHAMIEAAGKRDRILAVNHVMRYGPLAQTVRAIIDRGVLGRPLRGVFINRAGDGGLPPEHWFWNPDVSGGIFVEHGVHFFDLMAYWLAPLGPPAVLTAHRARRPAESTPSNTPLHPAGAGAAPAGVIDQVSCDVRYGPQTAVTFYHGFTQASPNDQQDCRLVFEHGQVRVTGWVAASIHIEALLDEPGIEQLNDLLPEARVETLHRYEGDAGRFQQRWQTRHADRYVHVRWQDHRDKQTIYGSALADLMADLLQTVADPRHAMRLSARDAVAALATALEADRLAAATTP